LRSPLCSPSWYDLSRRLPLLFSRSLHFSLSFPTRRSSDLDLDRTRHRGRRAAPRTRRHEPLPEPSHLVSLLAPGPLPELRRLDRDRKSTRLNSSHGSISYAVFCLKKKTINKTIDYLTT